MTGLASPSQIRMSFVRWAIVAVPLIVLLGSLSGGIGGSAGESSWYAALQKPALVPPEIGRAHVELQSLMRISYAVFCLKKKQHTQNSYNHNLPVTTYTT